MCCGKECGIENDKPPISTHFRSVIDSLFERLFIKLANIWYDLNWMLMNHPYFDVGIYVQCFYGCEKIYVLLLYLCGSNVQIM